MLPREYEGQDCSLARSLELIGERWTLLIVRDAFFGIRRFEHFHRNLGIARTVLTSRLARLEQAGIVSRHRYQEHPERFEYRLTPMGEELWVPVMTLTSWGDRHLAPDGPPRLIEHRECGGELSPELTCGRCGVSLGPHDVTQRPNPSRRAADRRRADRQPQAG
jgi:DNA-binding HxlR family transcriptional regulator